MYLELSRPDGDVSRWEKVLKRLTLLNKFYPMKNPRCKFSSFSREFEGKKKAGRAAFSIIRREAIRHGYVFFGGYASSVYKARPRGRQDPDFDLLAEDGHEATNVLVKALKSANIGKVKVKFRKPLWEVISESHEISVDDDIVCVVYQALGCHNYNVVGVGGSNAKVATIDTMLSLWLAMLYDSRSLNTRDRIYCMAQYLFETQRKHRLQQTGPLRRFGPTCIGEQPTLESAREDKSRMHVELQGKRGSKEYEGWFLNYRPTTAKKSQTRKRSKKPRSRRRKSKAAKR